MNDDVLSLLQNKEGPCISVILPTHELADGREGDMIEVKHAVAEVLEYLAHNYDNSMQSKLAWYVNELAGKIDFTHNSCGIGIFVSPAVQQLRQFHFPVTKKIIIGNSFEIRDVLYEIAYDIPYYLLQLTDKEVRLFEGRLDKLTEVEDAGFPQTYIDDYIYEAPGRANSYMGSAVTQSFEKDKSTLEKARHVTFFKKIDKLLDDLPVNEHILLVDAVSRELALFKKASRYSGRMFTAIIGNYSNDLNLLKAKAWAGINHVIDSNKLQALQNYYEETGWGRGEEGIENIWKAAKEGRALTLLVEKDFRKPGFICEDNDYVLHLATPAKEHTILPDAVDDIIEMVLEKKGDVIFLENGMLKDQHGIALITRY